MVPKEKVSIVIDEGENNQEKEETKVYRNRRSPSNYIRQSERGITVLPEPQEDEIDFLQDKPHHMTFGRRIALYLSQRYKWYNPHRGADTESPNAERNGDRSQQLQEQQQPPSLAKAWAFFEHVSLARYEVDLQAEAKKPDKSQLTTMQRTIRAFLRGDRKLDLAQEGERRIKTKLYPALTTPLKQMADFGLGYGVYFSVRCFVFCVCTCIFRVIVC